MTRRLDPWTCLTAGIPLTLLLDLAAGPGFDSRALLAEEAVAALAAAEWRATEIVISAIADRGQVFIA
jgi:hypothetical protein